MYDQQPENRGGIGSFSNCTNMDDQDVRVLALARGGTGAACFVVCAVTLVLVVSKRGLAGMRDSTQTRLMSYLLLSTAAYLSVLSAHMEHYWNYQGGKKAAVPRHDWQVCLAPHKLSSQDTACCTYYVCINLLHVCTAQIHLCEAIGLADQYTGSVQLFFTAGVSVHFVYHSLILLCSTSRCHHINFESQELSNRQKRVLETLLVVGSLVVPALYVWVPFVAFVPIKETALHPLTLGAHAQ